MKNVKSTAKKLLAILLCLLIAASMAVPAFADDPLPKAEWKWKGGVRVFTRLETHEGAPISTADRYQFLPQTNVVKFYTNFKDNLDNAEFIAGIHSRKEEKLDWLLDNLWNYEETKLQKFMLSQFCKEHPEIPVKKE